jgi:hypothetical protein
MQTKPIRKVTLAAPGLAALLLCSLTAKAGDGEERGNEGDEQELPQVAAVVPSGSGAKALLADANRQLAAMRTSSYSHKTYVNEADGTFDYDCSGLVDYSLARVAPEALHQLQQATARRPLAKHFVQFIDSIPPDGKKGRWHRVDRVQDLAPGDIVAWLKPADVSTKNTGHVMIVRGPVRPVRNRSGQIAVPVIDSTSVRHGAGDSRYRTQSTGLGTGTMYLTMEKTGIPRGYLWSHGSKSREHATAIALGRIE